MKTPTAAAWHSLAAARVVEQVGTDAASGLSAAEAARRLAEVGPNELRAAHQVSPWQVLLAQLKNVLILILLIAVVLSGFLGHAVEAVTIAVIVLFAVLLGFIQEYRAERALEALGEMAAPAAEVIRGGRTQTIPAREVVPGDVVVLKAGDRVPADGRLLTAANLRVEEAALTGESVPATKQVEAVAATTAAVGDRTDMVYAGTTVSYGRGRAAVVATGHGTELGRIAELVDTVETTRTPLQENLDRVGRVLARVALVVVVVIAGLGLLRGQPLLDMFLFAIALAVAVVPEALPAVVSISLALGVQRMVRRHALIRRLSAVETLGSTSTICSDKTGTLTRDEMTVRKLWTADLLVDVSGVGYEPFGELSADGAAVAIDGPLAELLTAGAVCNDARLEQEDDGSWSLIGDPTEGALVVVAAKAGLDQGSLAARLPRVDEVPFSSETKRMTTLHEAGDGGRVAYVKGAPEVVLSACSRLATRDGDVALTDDRRRQLDELSGELAGDGMRLLALASRRVDAVADTAGDATLLGLVAMADPPRPEAKEAIACCRSAGIRPVMITGDHPRTAAAIAAELDLLRDGRVVTGAELDRMDDQALGRAVAGIDVFSRVSPEHKLRVVKALQAHAEIVAMTGDGVNDAPALKRADIGVAMGRTGTDVSRESADMTLTDDNFASIVAAVEEGRGIFDNIKKYLMYLLSSNLGEVLLMATAGLFGLPLPLSAAQILYVNLATDGLPALALAVDPHDDDLMQRRPRDPRRGVFTRPVVWLMTAGGVWSAVVNLAIFVWALGTGRALAEAMTLTFVSLTLIQFIKAYNFRCDRTSVLHRPFANRWLNLAVLWEIGLLLALVYVPFLQTAFGTRPLTGAEWALVIAASATITPVLELVKWVRPDEDRIDTTHPRGEPGRERPRD